MVSADSEHGRRERHAAPAAMRASHRAPCRAAVRPSEEKARNRRAERNAVAKPPDAQQHRRRLRGNRRRPSCPSPSSARRPAWAMRKRRCARAGRARGGGGSNRENAAEIGRHQAWASMRDICRSSPSSSMKRRITRVKSLYILHYYLEARRRVPRNLTVHGDRQAF